MRRVFLSTLGLAAKSYGAGIGEQQEALLKLADIAIALYAAESAVARAQQALEQDEKKARHKVEMTQVFIDDALLETEMTARQIIQGMTEGEELARYTAMATAELSRLQRGGTATAKRQLAQTIYQAGHYIS